MEWVTNHILSILIFFPFFSALLVLALPLSGRGLMISGIVLSVLEFVFSLHLICYFLNTGTFEYMELVPWIEAFHIEYLVGIDGVSLWLILLTTLLTPLVFLASITSIKEKTRAYVFSMLLLEAGMVGVFCALDLFLFYVFWEVMLVPMYFIIGVWGGKERIYASIKFFIYTMAGSVLMLLAIIYLYQLAGGSFSLLKIYEVRPDFEVQMILFLAFALAFAIKVPIFPLHTWLPDAHVQAPTGGSVILAGVLLKMGTYGFYRFVIPLFPDAMQVAQPWLIALSVIGIIYGALVAMVQTDMKKLIAYSSVSHMGVVMLGLFALEKTAMQGGLFQMLSHGVSTGALFLLVGMIYERTHSREIADHGGFAKVLPLYSLFFLITTFASIGLPLTNGFVGEFLTLVGTFRAHPIAAVVSASGVILSAIYMLWLVERVFFGKLKVPHDVNVLDLSFREIMVMLPLVVLIFWMGIYPKPIFDRMSRSVDQVLLQAQGNQ